MTVRRLVYAVAVLLPVAVALTLLARHQQHDARAWWQDRYATDWEQITADGDSPTPTARCPQDVAAYNADTANPQGRRWLPPGQPPHRNPDTYCH